MVEEFLDNELTIQSSAVSISILPARNTLNPRGRLQKLGALITTAIVTPPLCILGSSNLAVAVTPPTPW
jgi:hypothetical protein